VGYGRSLPSRNARGVGDYHLKGPSAALACRFELPRLTKNLKAAVARDLAAAIHLLDKMPNSRALFRCLDDGLGTFDRGATNAEITAIYPALTTRFRVGPTSADSCRSRASVAPLARWRVSAHDLAGQQIFRTKFSCASPRAAETDDNSYRNLAHQAAAASSRRWPAINRPSGVTTTDAAGRLRRCFRRVSANREVLR